VPGLLQDPLLGRRGSLEIDGASKGNPGPAAAAFVLKEKGRKTVQGARTIGETTNNVAEYTALIDGVEKALELGLEGLLIRTDSELVARQLTGEYRVRKKHLMPLVAEAHALLRRLGSWRVQHVPREKNKRADSLCNKALRPRKS